MKVNVAEFRCLLRLLSKQPDRFDEINKALKEQDLEGCNRILDEMCKFLFREAVIDV